MCCSPSSHTHIICSGAWTWHCLWDLGSHPNLSKLLRKLLLTCIIFGAVLKAPNHATTCWNPCLKYKGWGLNPWISLIPSAMSPSHVTLVLNILCLELFLCNRICIHIHSNQTTNPLLLKRCLTRCPNCTRSTCSLPYLTASCPLLTLLVLYFNSAMWGLLQGWTVQLRSYWNSFLKENNTLTSALHTAPAGWCILQFNPNLICYPCTLASK